MTDIPIIFSAPMVLALLREVERPGTGKTMTRRLLYTKRKAKNGIVPASATLLKNHPPPRGRLGPSGFPTDIGVDEYWTLTGWHKAKPEDRLWVRETWHGEASYDDVKPRDLPSDACNVLYVADDRWLLDKDDMTHAGKTRVAIHMPRWASRLTLVVTKTKIERLNDISEADAIAEGIRVVNQGGVIYGVFGERYTSPQRAFRLLWESLHGLDSWVANPEVVALTFTVHKTNLLGMPEAVAA